MPAGWHEKYLGLPWAGVPEPPRSHTCGTLVLCELEAAYGFRTLPVPVPDARVLRDCIRAMADPSRYAVERVPEGAEIRDRDVAFMSRRRWMDHAGLAVVLPEGLRILHCSPHGGVQLSTLGELRAQGYTRIDFWRVPETARGGGHG